MDKHPLVPLPFVKRMKRFLFLAIILMFVTLTAVGVIRANRPPGPYTPQGPGEVYLALGDSLAWGFGLTDVQSESYPAIIDAALDAREAPALIKLAVPGETSSSFVARQLPRALRVIEETRRRGERVSPITLNIGGNDLRAVEEAGPVERAAAVEAVRRNLGRSLDALRKAAGSDADIAVMTYYNPYGGEPTVEGSEAYWVEALNTAIREEAARRGVAVAEVYGAFAGGREYTHTSILFGDIHANAQGHRLIAETFLTALDYAQP